MLGQQRMVLPWGVVICNRYGSGTPFWFGDQVPMQPLKERTFRHGVTDCYALVRDWFKVYRKVALPDLARDWEWWDTEENVLLEHFHEFGFIEIERSELKWGDCVMGKVGVIGSNVTNHCGVYLGEDQILHHLPNRPSRIDMLGPWSKIITHYCRYQP
jgi:cell wall-associated NlpC family hydrolase